MSVAPRKLRQRALAQAIAQQELEGLAVPEATRRDLERVARGELSSSDVIDKIYRRYPDVPVFNP
jgi:hypothetical protein